MVVEVEKLRYIYSVLRSCFSQPGAVIQDSLLHDLESLWWAFRFYSAITIRPVIGTLPCRSISKLSRMLARQGCWVSNPTLRAHSLNPTYRFRFNRYFPKLSSTLLCLDKSMTQLVTYHAKGTSRSDIFFASDVHNRYGIETRLSYLNAKERGCGT